MVACEAVWRLKWKAPERSSPGLLRLNLSLLGVQRSISISAAITATAPLIVETDTHNVVGEAAACGRQSTQARRSNRALSSAQVQVEVFKPRGPAVPQGRFDARASSPASLPVFES